MTALDELSRECERHGWLLRLVGVYPFGRQQPGLVVDALEVRGRGGLGLLARAPVPAPSGRWLEVAAAECGGSLRAQGLVRG